MRLEKQLEEAKKRLADAEANLARISAELEPKLAPLREASEKAKAAEDAAREHHERTCKEVRVRMGVDTKVWREQVAKWAGFSSLEEAEEHARERGEAMLPEVAADLAKLFVNRHPRVKATRQVLDAAVREHSRIEYDQIYHLTRPIRETEDEVRTARTHIRNIESKISIGRATRDLPKTPQDKAQHARFVAARQKLRTAMDRDTDRQPLVDWINAKLKENDR